MTQKQEKAFSIYIRDTENVLKNGTLWELDAIVDEYIKNRPPNPNILQTVLKLVGEKYSIPVKTLLISKERRTQTARQMAYCLLHLKFNLTQRNISKFFNTHQTTIARGIEVYKDSERLKDKKQFKVFFETYNELESKL
jgi:chromosomal replication initiation ATPase DnaA